MEPCGCHEEQLNSLRTSEGCLLLNYSGLKSFPVNLLCKRHAAKVRRIYAKCNLISSFAQDFHFTYCNVLELYLPLNRLTSIPETLTKLSRIERLNVDSNRISDVTSGVRCMTSLTHVVLRNNDIDTLPEEIALLKNLVSLDVSFNKLRRLPVSIDGCIHLKKLWLNRNRLSFLPRQVCFLKFLEELNVSSNNVVHFPLDLGKSPALQSVSLDDNKMIYAVPRSMKRKICKFNCRGRRQLTSELASHFGLRLLSLQTASGPFSALQPLDVRLGGDRSEEAASLKELSAKAACASYGDVSDFTTKVDSLPWDLRERLLAPLGHCDHCDEPMFWRAYCHHSGTAEYGDARLHFMGFYCSVSCHSLHDDLLPV